MNDEQVANEMKKMVSFIHQEAVEKSRELKIKADEDYDIEKAKLVMKEASLIEINFAKKYRQEQSQRKITQSTMKNKKSIEIHHFKEEHLRRVMNEALSKLMTLDESEKYSQLLFDLILEAMLMILDSKMVIRCREKDKEIINGFVGQLESKYEELTSSKTKLSISPRYSKLTELGISLYNMSGTISCDNTFEKRLSNGIENILPDIKQMIKDSLN